MSSKVVIIKTKVKNARVMAQGGISSEKMYLLIIEFIFIKAFYWPSQIKSIASAPLQNCAPLAPDNCPLHPVTALPGTILTNCLMPHYNGFGGVSHLFIK